MDIKNIVVKEYLESLTEKNELNYIFPILLESLGFIILSKPTEYLGIQEYGKDIVAVGFDDDGIKIRFLHFNNLIQAKKAAGRHRDLDDIEKLTKKKSP